MTQRPPAPGSLVSGRRQDPGTGQISPLPPNRIARRRPYKFRSGNKMRFSDKAAHEAGRIEEAIKIL